LSAALKLLAQIAPEFGAICVHTGDRTGRLNLPIRLVDGRTIPYSLALRESAGEVSVREEVPEHLPAFCPERHINSDGTFCLSYSPVQPLKIEDEETARAWMETTYKFLKLQERARAQRRWPNDRAWAHGGAAEHQLRALEAVVGLGDKLVEAQSSRQLVVRRRHSKNRPVLELMHHGKCLYRVWETEKRVANQRKRCFCCSSGRQRPKTLRKCADHGARAAELVLALYEWEREEKHYWDTMRGKDCCGTCDACPLANSIS